MKKLMKKITILATVATMATMAISTSASAGWLPSTQYLDQYDIKASEQYAINTEHNTIRNIEVTDVYEKDGKYFGTNRTIKWIDIDTGETGESTLGMWGDTRVYAAGTTFTWVH